MYQSFLNNNIIKINHDKNELKGNSKHDTANMSPTADL